ncbi:MAG: hypothetical protein HQL07_06495 [Nitrospirae bacterium]|nr:hypothetical protein [Magnetococcales bacterium]HAT51370.1 hypothetical protein [Alphaproteobacteria bacterium]
MVDQDPYRSRAQSLLKSEKVQGALADLVAKYWCEFHPVFRTATGEENGRRPENVSNEMFSCLHHIVRGLVNVENETDSAREIRKAVDSHIKRGTLDSYKIAINSILEEDKVLVELLDYILLADDNLDGNFKDRITHIKRIQQLKRECKVAYIDAKKMEAEAQWSRAIARYEAAMGLALNIRDSLATIHDDPVTVSFLVREGKRRGEREEDAAKRLEERKQDKKHDLVKAVVVAVISATLSAFITQAIVSSRSGAMNHSSSVILSR